MVSTAIKQRKWNFGFRACVWQNKKKEKMNPLYCNYKELHIFFLSHFLASIFGWCPSSSCGGLWDLQTLDFGNSNFAKSDRWQPAGKLADKNGFAFWYKKGSFLVIFWLFEIFENGICFRNVKGNKFVLWLEINKDSFINLGSNRQLILRPLLLFAICENGIGIRKTNRNNLVL